jgi:OmcA/MtrC family decaheme c-type cytochrome
LGFHNGDRNDPTACNICHNGNGVDGSGFPYDSSTWYHGIHGASQRTYPFVTEASTKTPSATADDFSGLLFPGQLKNCENCHLPNTANFGIAEATGQLTNKLWSYTATGTVVANNAANVSVLNVMTGVAKAVGTYVLPTVPAGTLTPAAPATTYGSGFSYGYSATTGTYYATYAAGTTLVNSPFASACSSCHDDAVSQNHIADQGGQIHMAHPANAASGVLGSDVGLINKETCLTCHGQGRVNDAELMHQQR